MPLLLSIAPLSAQQFPSSSVFGLEGSIFLPLRCVPQISNLRTICTLLRCSFPSFPPFSSSYYVGVFRSSLKLATTLILGLGQSSSFGNVLSFHPANPCVPFLRFLSPFTFGPDCYGERRFLFMSKTNLAFFVSSVD